MARFLSYISFVLLFLLASCKKDMVDGSSVKAFQASVNDMSSSLSTLEQTKFHEALYILKTFAVEGDTDLQKLEALAKMINAKKVPEIFALADEVARKNNVEWSSTAPPSLGEMNIFQNISAMEVDVNDITAASLDILVKPIEVDSIVGAKALRVIPKLLDNQGKEVVFSNAGLETIMEVYSNGERLLTSKNLMADNHFKGFYLKMESLPLEKVVDSRIDIKMSVKTSKKTYQFLKVGVEVNENALSKPKIENIEGEENVLNQTLGEDKAYTEKPDNIVATFLNSVGSRNLKRAFNVSENPNWGAFEQFSDTTTGFGAVKSISVKNISTISNNTQSAEVKAEYQVEDNDGNLMFLNTTYTLKATENGWKISNYKINSSQKQ